MEIMKDPAHPSGLESHTGYWLRMVSNQVSQAFSAKLEARGVSVAEWVALRLLYDAPTPPSVLAERLGMTRGAVTKIADRLIAGGLVTRQASESDRRAQRLSLSDKGAALVPELAAIADANDAAFFGGLSIEDRATLEKILRRLASNAAAPLIPTS